MAQESSVVDVNGNAVRDFRKARGLSVAELIDKAQQEYAVDLSRSYLCNIELGHRQPSAKIALAIAGALRVNVTSLLRDPNVQLSDPPTSQVDQPAGALT